LALPAFLILPDYFDCVRDSVFLDQICFNEAKKIQGGVWMATVKIQYFAQLRDLVGKSHETISVAADSPAASLYLELAERYRFPLKLTDIRVAINDEFADPYKTLKDGDQIVFIPPVAGG
jgi:molybdopterin converting factor subunit 1